MDTSETYIKMCEKAEEIQEIKLRTFSKDFEAGDYYLYRGGVYQGEEIELADSLWKRPQSCVWLPRQDQLQEMVEWKKEGTYGVLLIDAFYNWAKNTFNPQPWGDDSMTWEQLWLAFVMKEKYGKIWEGGNWINEGK